MYWFIFENRNLLLARTAEGSYLIPSGEKPPVAAGNEGDVLRLPMLNGEECRTFRVTTVPPEVQFGNLEAIELRSTFTLLAPADYRMAGKASELIFWHEGTRFCGRCGKPMEFHSAISKRCPACGREVWPHVNPAIIVRIRREAEYGADGRQLQPERILLVHARNFRRPDYYGLVAGFVETGETLEECVAREVKEETGLRIANLRYFGSQPWPFPSGVMVAFTADYVSGDLHLQEEELTRAGWYDRDHMPPVPDESSIARWLIDDWVEHPDYDD